VSILRIILLLFRVHFRDRSQLAPENLALRQQLAVILPGSTAREPGVRLPHLRLMVIEATDGATGSPGQPTSQKVGSAGHGLDSVPHPLAFCPSRYCTR